MRLGPDGTAGVLHASIDSVRFREDAPDTRPKGRREWGYSSTGRATALQAEDRGSSPRFSTNLNVPEWRNGRRSRLRPCDFGVGVQVPLRVPTYPCGGKADAGGSNPPSERSIGSSPIRDTNTVRNSALNINKSGIPLIWRVPLRWSATGLENRGNLKGLGDRSLHSPPLLMPAYPTR